MYKEYYRFEKHYNISNQQKLLTGFRKKRAAPVPPRPLSSATSTQTLERIVDSEESLTSDMEPSKPSSDIGVPSKASSDIDCSKVNSDININTQSIRQLDRKPKSEIAMCESDCDIQQNCMAESNTEACSKSHLICSKIKMKVIAPVEAISRVEQARVTTKRGKLVGANDLNALFCDSKMRDSSRNPQVGEGTNVERKTLKKKHIMLCYIRESVDFQYRRETDCILLIACNMTILRVLTLQTIFRSISPLKIISTI